MKLFQRSNEIFKSNLTRVFHREKQRAKRRWPFKLFDFLRTRSRRPHARVYANAFFDWPIFRHPWTTPSEYSHGPLYPLAFRARLSLSGSAKDKTFIRFIVREYHSYIYIYSFILEDFRHAASSSMSKQWHERADRFFLTFQLAKRNQPSIEIN